MIDVVRDLELVETLEREREQAWLVAEQCVERLERHVALVRHCFDAGDEAHARGDDEIAERLWYVGEVLCGEHDDDELDELESGAA